MKIGRRTTRGRAPQAILQGWRGDSAVGRASDCFWDKEEWRRTQGRNGTREIDNHPNNNPRNGGTIGRSAIGPVRRRYSERKRKRRGKSLSTTTHLSSLQRCIFYFRRARDPLRRTKGWSRDSCHRKRGQDDTGSLHTRRVSKTGRRRLRNTSHPPSKRRAASSMRAASDTPSKTAAAGSCKYYPRILSPGICYCRADAESGQHPRC